MLSQHTIQYLDEYTMELEVEIKSLEKEKELLNIQIQNEDIEQKTLKLLREQLWQFIINIKQEPTDIQYSLLKNYLSTVTTELEILLVPDNASNKQSRNKDLLRSDLNIHNFVAPDLDDIPKRLIKELLFK